MIKSITIINDLNESIDIVLTQPELSGFIVSSINGLGPVKANINQNELATSDGSIFNSARLSYRNIVLELLFDETADLIETIRQKSYKYFPIKRQITFQIFTDNRNLEITGFVESNEPEIFSDKEGTQISIICPDPYFHSTESQTTVFYGVESLFEFEFENDSLTEPLLEMGSIEQKREQTVYYTGDAEVGVTISIYLMGGARNISVYNVTTREIMRINTDALEQLVGSGLAEGDTIIINTSRGSKSIQLLRDGTYINILNCLDRNTDWFRLVKGDNVFTYTAYEGLGNIHFKIENLVLYEGV